MVVSVVPLKPAVAVLEPDPWWDAFVMFDGTTFRKRNLEDHHRFIDAIQLSADVPNDVRQLFENARNTYLYAFFAHRLLMVAELQAYVSVEYALRKKAITIGRKVPEWWGMSRLFELAMSEKWIADDGFAVYRRNEAARKRDIEARAQINPNIRYELPKDPQAYCRVLADSFTSLRNIHAHGQDMIYPSVLGTFDIAVDLIHQLFSPTPNQKLEKSAEQER